MESPGQSYKGLGAESCVTSPHQLEETASEAPAYFCQAPSQVTLEPTRGGAAAGSLIWGSTTRGEQQNPLLCQPSAFKTCHGKQHKYEGGN